MLSFNSRTAIIILNYNNFKTTIDSVNRLINLDGNYYIVIVDNNSTDDSLQILKNAFGDVPGIDVVSSKNNGGYSSGNNIGARRSIKLNPNLEFIAIMNPDVIIEDKEIFNQMIDKAKENKEIAVITAQMVENGEIQTTRAGWNLNSIWQRIFARTAIEKYFVKNNDYEISGTLRFVDAVHGSFFIIKRSVFEDIGFLDENIFLYAEETALAFKLKRRGLKACIDKEYSYVHAHEYKKETKEKMIAQGKMLYKSLRYVVKKYYRGNFFQIFLFDIIQGGLYYIYYPVLFSIKHFLIQFE